MKNSTFSFASHFKLFAIISAILIVVGVVGLVTLPFGLNLFNMDVDFLGGVGEVMGDLLCMMERVGQCRVGKDEVDPGKDGVDFGQHVLNEWYHLLEFSHCAGVEPSVDGASWLEDAVGLITQDEVDLDVAKQVAGDFRRCSHWNLEVLVKSHFSDNHSSFVVVVIDGPDGAHLVSISEDGT